MTSDCQSENRGFEFLTPHQGEIKWDLGIQCICVDHAIIVIVDIVILERGVLSL